MLARVSAEKCAISRPSITSGQLVLRTSNASAPLCDSRRPVLPLQPNDDDDENGQDGDQTQLNYQSLEANCMNASEFAKLGGGFEMR